MAKTLRVCSWCGLVLGVEEMANIAKVGITHGICANCKKKMLAKAGLNNEEEHGHSDHHG